MDWLNLHTSVLDSPECLRCDPVRRATWIWLLRHAIGQENGGRIVNCRSWGDTTWQQLCRVRLREVNMESSLWSWDGEDLIVAFYPAEKEAEVRAKRANGKRGGRPQKEPNDNHEVSSRFQSAETEGKGIGKEGNGSADAPTPEQALGPWIRTRTSDPEGAEANRQELRQLVAVHGPKAVQAKAEQLAHAAGGKVWPSDLSAAFLATKAEPFKAPALNFTPKYA